MGLGTWDLGLGTWDLGSGTWDLVDLGPGTWDLTRVPAVEYNCITSQISQDGLKAGSVRLHADNWDDNESLMMIIWTPPADFAHVLNEVGLQERDLGANSHHISICDMRDVRAGWCQWK